MKRIILLIGLVGLFVAGVASGEPWYKGCDANGSQTKNVALGGFVCTSPDANENSPMLSVSTCDNFDVLFWFDIDDAGADANTVNIYSCANPTDGSGVGPDAVGWNAAGVCWLLENVTLDGDPATNTEAIYGAAGEWIYVDVLAWVDDTPRVIVRCNPPRL